MKRKNAEEGGVGDGVSWCRGELIGKGGFGSVYLANLKKPKSRNGIYPPVMAVKSAEVSVSCSLQKEKEVFDHLLDCPYILQCFGEETTTNNNGEMVYNLLLEYASGGTLTALIKKSGGFGLPEIDVKRYTRSILKCIDYIHSHGYVHCDLKPDNVLLVSAENGDFVPKIGDFGLAKKSERNSKRRKLDSCIGGTTLYMAPETLVENIQESPSDIWALGCIVFEMFTGKKVWDSKPDMKTNEIIQKIADRYELPKIPCDISKDAKDFLKRCLVKNPMFRFTAEMLLDHPFVSEIDDRKSSEFGEILDEGWANSSVTLSNPNNEFCASSSSEDWSSTSGEGSSSSSWSSEDVEESDCQEFRSSLEFTESGVQGSSIYCSPLSAIIDKHVSSHMVKHCPTIFTIPTGAH